MSTAQSPTGAPVNTGLKERLAPLLAGELLNWRGLPSAHTADFDALFGNPYAHGELALGAWPAIRCAYRDAQGRGLVLWSRQDRAVMVEAETLPPCAVVAQLPQPDRILPHEILVLGHYAHEYLYCAIGLVLTVAEPLSEGRAHIARCRGIAPLTSPEDFGSAWYLAFEDRTSWTMPEAAQ